ncbi:Crp/Fnr family transcriptional regulator [Kribbella sp. NBC_00359]|uniref:Crp/Fnr family transcriptional regulator n=1 Tax=Kribbella sp. NBC_00359 TaxID=2975966 RepID=UPI002E1AF423
MSIPVLDALDQDTRTRLIRAGNRRRFTRNEVVFHEGDPAETLYLLITGHVCVRVTTPMGDTAILAVLGSGSTFGELALLSSDQPRAATVAALDSVETLVLARDQFTRLRHEFPGVDRFLVDLLAGYIRQLDMRLIEARYVPVGKRVLRQVLELSRIYGDGSRGTVIPLTQETLAGLAGSTRATTNQTLRSAATSGLITLDRGRVRIEDPVTLARRAK